MMFDSLNPIWSFLGGVTLRDGGDLLKILIQFGIQRLTCQVTIVQTNPNYLQCRDDAHTAVANYDFAQLQVLVGK